MKIRFNNREKQAPNVSKGMKVPYAPGRRLVPQWRWWLILTLVSSPFVYLLYTIIMPLLVVTASGFITLEKETLVAVTASAVEQVTVQAGDRVQRGQVLAELVAPKLEEQIAVLHKMLEPVPGYLSAVGTDGPMYQNALIDHYRQQEQHASQAVEHHQQRLGIVTGLFKQEAATVAEVNAVRSQLDGARHILIQAKVQRINAKQQAKEQAELAARQQVQQGARQDNELLRQQLTYLQTQQQDLTLRAGDNGTVLEILAERGNVLVPGEGVLVVGQQERPFILAYLHPSQVQWVTAGTDATVAVSGEVSVQARVRKNPSQALRLPTELSSALASRDMMVLVTLDLIDPLPPERAIEGLPVKVRFHRSWSMLKF